MICTINPDRFGELVQAERRLKFLEAFLLDGNRMTLSDWRGQSTFAVGSGYSTVADVIEILMARYPELCEEITEVVANG